LNYWKDYRVWVLHNAQLLLNKQQQILRNDLYCVGWGVKLYSLTHSGVASISTYSTDNLYEQ